MRPGTAERSRSFHFRRAVEYKYKIRKREAGEQIGTVIDLSAVNRDDNHVKLSTNK